jgi:hypothetical protein
MDIPEFSPATLGKPHRQTTTVKIIRKRAWKVRGRKTASPVRHES